MELPERAAISGAQGNPVSGSVAALRLRLKTGADKASRLGQQARGWLSEHREPEHIMLGLILVAGAALLGVIWAAGCNLYGVAVEANYNYLLSSVVQGLAAILALLVTISVVATQMAAGSYTPNVIEQRIRDPWLWFAVAIYLVAIGWSLALLANPAGWLRDAQASQGDVVDTALVLAGAALFYIFPFALATLRRLRPSYMAGWFVKRDNYAALDELVRRSINEGMMTLFTDALGRFAARARNRLDGAAGGAAVAAELAGVFLAVGRHACQRQSPDALGAVMGQLTSLIEYCNEPPRLWRGAADEFNDVVRELYLYAEEWMLKEER